MTLPRFIATCAACLLSFGASAADYHGFQIDESAAALGQAARASLQAQLDIVDAVGLPAPVLAVLKQMPIVVDPGLRGNPGMFAVREGHAAVYVRPMVFAANKPILLHELLHAYDFSVLHMDSVAVREAYRHAKEGNVFPARFQSAHFLENGKEFFAVTGTLYLFGDIQQPPFSCAALGQLDADYLAFLGRQFGPHTCRPQP